MAYDASEHIIERGKRLEFADTLNGSRTRVYGTIEINFPERELGAAEYTNDDTPNNSKSYGPGEYDPGKVPFTYRYGKTTYAALETIFNLPEDPAQRNTAIKYWFLTLPDGAQRVGRGFLTKHQMPMGGDGNTSPVVEAEIQTTEKWTFTPTGGS
jgi:hypothetical protein